MGDAAGARASLGHLAASRRAQRKALVFQSEPTEDDMSVVEVMTNADLRVWRVRATNRSRTRFAKRAGTRPRSSDALSVQLHATRRP